MRLLLVWILNAIALLAVAYLFPGVQIQDWKAAAVAALVLGLVNALIKPILVILTLPVTILTLGLVPAGHQRAAVLGGRDRCCRASTSAASAPHLSARFCTASSRGCCRC